MVSPIIKRSVALANAGILQLGGSPYVETKANGLIQVFRDSKGNFKKLIKFTNKKDFIAFEKLDQNGKHLGFGFENTQGTIESTIKTNGELFDIRPRNLLSNYDAQVMNNPLLTCARSRKTGTIHCPNETRLLIRYMIGGKNAPTWQNLQGPFAYAMR